MNVPPTPPWTPVGAQQQFTTDQRETESLIDRLLEGRKGAPHNRTITMSEQEITTLCGHAKTAFMSQPMFLELEAPLKVAGDTHGQFCDLLRLFSYGGWPPMSNYLFLGDYVDRGRQSVETIVLLLAYKVRYPENFFLLRGNHECAAINRVYGFYDECKRRYSIKMWKGFQDVFNCMPVSALIDEKILCMHGGLSPDLKTFDVIRRAGARPIDIPDNGILCDLLWADPDKDVRGFQQNTRGVSYIFGPDEVDRALKTLNIDLICRGHQVVEDGYEFFHNQKLVTLFSAPNYCGEFDNAGGLMSIDENLMCSFQILRASGYNKSKKQKATQTYDTINYTQR